MIKSKYFILVQNRVCVILFMCIMMFVGCQNPDTNITNYDLLENKDLLAENIDVFRDFRMFHRSDQRVYGYGNYPSCIHFTEISFEEAGCDSNVIERLKVISEIVSLSNFNTISYLYREDIGCEYTIFNNGRESLLIMYDPDKCDREFAHYQVISENILYMTEVR
ncbi:MAG TPA: hypothetical protein DCE78_00400 [Bacteroidetes bacterium]|nr:hypothetical protein [Bacteroidota bacterium]